MVKIQRMSIGIATSIAILALLDLLPSPVPQSLVNYRLLDHFYVWPGIGGMVTMFVAAFGGGFVSKARFEIPAVILAVGVWVFIVYFLNSTGAAAGQDDWLTVASTNLLGLILGVFGAAFGAYAGTRMASRNSPGGNVAAV